MKKDRNPLDAYLLFDRLHTLRFPNPRLQNEAVHFYLSWKKEWQMKCDTIRCCPYPLFFLHLKEQILLQMEQEFFPEILRVCPLFSATRQSPKDHSGFSNWHAPFADADIQAKD